ncbi:MAG: putative RNA-binding Zn-ribbon protein involved in translation (DUF1610 family) [Myxococcota bacterium]|jgi:predicted RNA-binding Zn-ribbon protein involved in translation (DUF1610 family)
MALGLGSAQALLAGSALTGTRAALPLLVLSAAGYAGLVAFPEGAEAMATLPMVAALAGLAVVEELTERDEDVQEILSWLNYGTRGAAGAMAAWLADAAPAGMPAWSVALLGVLIAATTHHYRMQLHASLRGLGDTWLSPRTWLVTLEAGGVAALAIGLVLAPAVASTAVVLLLAAEATWHSARWATQRTVWRHPCPACGARIRREASRCPSCRETVEPDRWLA